MKNKNKIKIEKEIFVKCLECKKEISGKDEIETLDNFNKHYIEFHSDKSLTNLNKKGGAFAYIFWILVGIAIGIYFTLRFFCK